MPAFDEEDGIAGSVAELSGRINATGWPYEILVVDDGSSDQTAVRAREAGATVVRHDANLGYGAALKTGIRRAQYPVICITDADGTYPADRLTELVEPVASGRIDMAVGSRAGEDVNIPMIRRPAKWMIGRLANLAAGRAIPDLNSGFRVFRRDVVMRFFNLLPAGFSFTSTITLAMMSNGYSVSYLPIDYRHRKGRSKFRPIMDTLNFIGLVLRTTLYFAPLKVFLPAAGLLYLLAIVVGLFTKLVLGQLADVVTVVISMTATQVGIVGLLAELVNRRLPQYYQSDE
jgi:glycosyltransferase involved in cell wall biosynthesis